MFCKLVGRFVNIVGFVFGIDDFLASIQTEIAGEHITESNR